MARRPTVIPAADPLVIAELADLRAELLADDELQIDEPAELVNVTRRPGRGRDRGATVAP